MFGLRDDDIKTITGIIEKYDVEYAIIFGSRAKGNYKNGSDVDIALKGANVNYDIVLEISMELNEETLMPYHFDIVNYSTIRNDALIEHIDRAGIEFYKKKKIAG